MALFKGTVVGLGSLAVLMVLWKIVVGAFIVGAVLFKLAVFVVLPIVLLAWVWHKYIRNGERVGA